jgi:beta-lactamase superfamily II metal-dependent hydrolase
LFHLLWLVETKMTETNLPPKGVVFWPVGTGDSTTVVVDDEHVLQVDLRDMALADEPDAVHAQVIDRLAEVLPERDGAPYLSVFALTHADQDHCTGFGDLLDSEIVIGELWATPRLWREFTEDAPAMCEDAKRFHEEANRRVDAVLAHIAAGRPVPSGDMIRVIGYDEDQSSDLTAPDYAYAGLPKEYFSFPGQVITTMDRDDVSDRFEAFVHAPFKGDCAAARNDTSLALRIILTEGTASGRILLMGDLAYATISRILDISDAEAVAWDVLLAPHHCSKKVMYAPGEDGEEERKDDIMVALEDAAGPGAYIVASSQPFPAADKPGANPPHIAAKQRYQEIIDADHFLCTQEHGSEEDPRPIIFALGSDGLALVTEEEVDESGDVSRLAKVAAGAISLAAAQRQVKRARGTDAAPAKAVGFGHR